ncbi:MAG: [Fe-Fe] hydrogenase large subunit C-terminal domain-containing protein [bacterium]|nr:[Fe-Fe] hydrogenase large subunit C-terminal domain-containing protein [bacterium]
MSYFHSVTLQRAKCKGCTNCIKRCPTEAIRVREGKAHILEERCVDCGECIRICPNQAKVAVTDRLERLEEFRYNVALPAPAFFGQFGRDVDPGQVLGGLINLGFDHVVEVALGADVVTAAIRRYLREHPQPRPLISSACPTVVRLIQVRFPSLVDHIIPLHTPMDVAALLARRQAREQHGLADGDVGTWFITPCPAKLTAVRQPVGMTLSEVTGAFSMAEIYGMMLPLLAQAPEGGELQQASAHGFGWGRAGGENQAIGAGALLSVDGIHNVIALLEEVLRDRLGDLDYLELQACVAGCVGGSLVAENPFVGRTNLRMLTERLGATGPGFPEEAAVRLLAEAPQVRGPVEPRPVMRLDEDPARAISKTEQLERVLESLPGLDCGSCGSPHCRSLAEDIVRGRAFETDCVFKLREQVHALAAEMLELAHRLPPAMGQRDEGEDGADSNEA